MGIPVIGDIIDGVKDIVSEVVVDKDKKIEIDYRLAELADRAQARLDAQLQGQIEVNKVEAASNSLFVAGYRPAIGWVGAVGLGYSFVFAPFIEFIARSVFHWQGVMPMPDMEQLLPLVLAMLGVGGMRSYEKIKGVATGDLSTANASKVSEPVPDRPKKRWKL